MLIVLSLVRLPIRCTHITHSSHLQMAEVCGRLRQEEEKLTSERAQHSAAARDLMAAQEDVLELRRRIRIAVRALPSLHLHRDTPGPVHSATLW
jgi:Tfp pilus assembly protein PilO